MRDNHFFVHLCDSIPLEQMVSNRTSEQKNGCPSCAEYGFNPGQKAIVYLLEQPDKMKIGITNLKTETIQENMRIKRHQCNGWILIDHIVFEKGQDAYDLEQAILSYLDIHNISRGSESFLEMFDGITESWRSADYAPRTIMEITTT